MSQIEQEAYTAIKNKIREFIINNFLFGDDFSSPQDNDSFLDTGILDSTGILELITFIEENYGISIEDDELLPENLDSLNNVEKFIKRKRSNDSG